jgi:hypothetical protein
LIFDEPQIHSSHATKLLVDAFYSEAKERPAEIGGRSKKQGI